MPGQQVVEKMPSNFRTRRNSDHYDRLSISLSIIASSFSVWLWFSSSGRIISFKRLPVEAYPDVANTWVQVITQWPGRAAKQVEQQVTIPIEISK